MLLVADSGSTKTDWALVSGREVVRFETVGVNPYFHTSDEIFTILDNEIPGEHKNGDISDIYFYGAGVSSNERAERVNKALARIFTRSGLHIEHDLLGAARALCGYEKGIATIMGTGSNACLYDGGKIVQQSGGIGYILGDEASGAYLGRKFFRALFYGDLPETVEQDFYRQYGSNKNIFIEAIYRKPDANRYLASFAKFIGGHIADEFMYNLVYTSMNDFFQNHIVRFEGYTWIPVHAVGSVAFHFSDILCKVITENAGIPGRIEEKPIDRLVAYHTELK